MQDRAQALCNLSRKLSRSLTVSATTEEAPKVLPTANELAVERTDLALLRSYLAIERTLMAWVRTAISLIGFGYTVVKAIQTLKNPSFEARGPFGYVHGLRISQDIGYALVMIGTITLILALVQHIVMVNELVALGFKRRLSLSALVAILLGILGIFAFSTLAMEM